MKTFLILILGSISLAAGGVALLYLNGDNVLSPALWKLAFQAMITTPDVLFTEALSGDEVEFFRGIMIAVGGVMLAAFFSVLAVLSIPLRSLLAGVKGSKKSSTGWNDKEDNQGKKAAKAKSADKEKSSLKFSKKIRFAMAAVKAKLPKKKDGFVDVEADLEGEEGGRKYGFLQRMKDKFARQEKGKKTLVIKSGKTEESVMEIEDTSDFLADLKVWYNDIRSAPKEDPECIEVAKSLLARASRRARAKVVDEDMMNGEFMLRMMDAWASKKPSSQSPEPLPILNDDISDIEDDGSTFTRAIQDVMTDGVSTDDDDEDDEFRIEEVDDESDDFIIQDIDDEDPSDTGGDDEDDDFILPGEDLEDDGADEILDNSVEDGDATDGGELKSLKAASYIIDLEMKAASIANFEEEWDEDLSEPEARRSLIDEMFDALEKALVSESSEIMELSSFDAGEDQREVDWLQENIETIADKKASLIEMIALFNGSDEEGEDDDLEAAFGIGGGASDIADEDDTGNSAIDLEDNPEAKPEDDIHEDVSDETGDLNTGSETVPEVVVETTPEREGVVSEVTDEVEDDAPEAVSVTEPEEEKPYVPQNRTLAELAEFEASDELIYKWGYVAKGAGAAEAKISHSVLIKDGLRRRVAGISHLVAQWRSADSEDNRRLNILLRFVPEGEWSLVMDNHRESGIMMVDTNGDFVQVSAELLRQPEIENSIVLVHFYGPGVSSGVLEEDGNVIVTTDTLSVETIKNKMDT